MNNRPLLACWRCSQPLIGRWAIGTKKHMQTISARTYHRSVKFLKDDALGRGDKGQFSKKKEKKAGIIVSGDATALRLEQRTEKATSRQIESNNRQDSTRAEAETSQSLLARTINATSDLVEGSTDLIGGMSESVANATSDAIEGTGRLVGQYLPKTDVKVPRVAHDAADIGDHWAREAGTLVKSGWGLVESLGSLGGQFAIATIKETQKALIGDEKKRGALRDYVGDDVAKASQRLANSSTRAVTTVLSSADTVVTRVASSTSKAGVQVARDVLGDEIGDIVHRGVASTTDIADAAKSIKTLGSKKLLKKMGKSARKEALKEYFESQAPDSYVVKK